MVTPNARGAVPDPSGIAIGMGPIASVGTVKSVGPGCLLVDVDGAD